MNLEQKVWPREEPNGPERRVSEVTLRLHITASGSSTNITLRQPQPCNLDNLQAKSKHRSLKGQGRSLAQPLTIHNLAADNASWQARKLQNKRPRGPPDQPVII